MPQSAAAIWGTLVEWFSTVFAAFCAIVAMVKGAPLLYHAGLKFINGVDTLVNINDKLAEGNGRMGKLEISVKDLSEHLARQDSAQQDSDKLKMEELGTIKRQIKDLRSKVESRPPNIQT